MGKQPQPAVRGYFDAREVLDAARGRWESVLAGFGVRTELLTGRHGPCPGCGGRDRFRFDDKEGEGTFICSQGGGGNLSGNGLTLLQHVTGWEWKRCVEEIGRRYLSDSQRRGWNGESGDAPPPREDLPEEPRGEVESVPKFSHTRLRSFIEGMPTVTRDDLRAMSPVRVEKASAADFFEVLYGTDERVLVFTNFYSQGDFLYQVGKGSCRLAATRGVKAVVSPLPTTAREGIWFLCNPVNGRWEIGPLKRRIVYPGGYGPKMLKVVERLGLHGPPQLLLEQSWVRRTWKNVTSFRYAVLESDTVPEEQWLKVLIKLPLPIVAIYTSGGRSLHALVRIDAGDKLTWDMMVRGRSTTTFQRRTSLMDLVCPLGADANALTAVRLTRLPFCFREGARPEDGPYKRYESPRLQELLYLAPVALNKPMPWKSLELRHGGLLR